MTEPMERELEELLYQMGIYLVQSGTALWRRLRDWRWRSQVG